jgi:hypothetical protein
MRRWIVPLAVGLAVLAVIADAVLVLPHRRPTPQPVVVDRIGLEAKADADGIRLQWDRNANSVRTATHASLSISDGNSKSQLNLTDKQLASYAVRYWPETQRVRFRLNLYRGTETVADEVEVLANPTPITAETSRSRAVIEKARPSPFERARPEVVRKREDRSLVASEVPKPPETAAVPKPQTVAAPKESRWGHLVSRIPLLRRLKKHPQAPDSQPVVDTEERR